jgi:hypothetical protein
MDVAANPIPPSDLLGSHKHHQMRYMNMGDGAEVPIQEHAHKVSGIYS